MSRIRDAFEAARSRGRVAMIPYLTAGDPSPERTVDLVLALDRCGADLVELGVPFSDPLADGEINQRAAARALARGMNLGGVLDVAGRIRRASTLPLVLFTYFNPLWRMGLKEFSRRAGDAGVDGVLATDLPVEEGDDLREALGGAGLETIFLAAPTTGEARLRRIGEASGGFIYYVSRTGVTGERRALPEDAAEKVRAIRRLTGKKVAVGFGISSKEHVREISSFADGAVIGSALMRVVEETGDIEELAGRVEARFRAMLPTQSPR